MPGLLFYYFNILYFNINSYLLVRHSLLHKLCWNLISNVKVLRGNGIFMRSWRLHLHKGTNLVPTKVGWLFESGLVIWEWVGYYESGLAVVRWVGFHESGLVIVRVGWLSWGGLVIMRMVTTVCSFHTSHFWLLSSHMAFHTPASDTFSLWSPHQVHSR